MSGIKGNRTRHCIRMNPNKASPSDELYIDIRKLKMDSLVVPVSSLHLLYTFKISNTKTTFTNNLSALLQKRLQIQVASEIVYDNTGESKFTVQKKIYVRGTLNVLI